MTNTKIDAAHYLTLVYIFVLQMTSIPRLPLTVPNHLKSKQMDLMHLVWRGQNLSLRSPMAII